MPTYVYRRPDGTTFDAFQRISDPPLTEDPETGVPVTRVISGGAGLQFKGDGFYLTDYARKGKPESASETSDKKEAKGETKPSEPKKADGPKTPASTTSTGSADS